MTATAIGTAFASLWPATHDVSPAYRRSCRLLDLETPPQMLLSASYAAATSCWLLGSAVLVVGNSPLQTLVCVGLWLCAAAIALAGHYGPIFAAEARRIRALGVAPALVTTMVFGATLWPNPERVTTFASTVCEGLLADQLGGHARRANGTPRSGVQAFASEWREAFPSLGRSARLVERATTAPADERDAILETARQCILDGTREEMATFASSLRSPATALYAFGVFLPLALVSLLPAVTATGLGAIGPLLVVVYGMVLPLGLVVASGWLLGQRPVAFPPEPVARSHPDVPATAWRAGLTGVGAAIGGWLMAGLFLPGWGQPLAALGAGVGTSLLGYYRPTKAVREHVRAVEASLPDAMTAIGRRVDRGQSVEAAIEAVVEEVSDPLATVLDATVEQQRLLGVGIEAAFCGTHGTLRAIPSARTRRTAAALGAAAEIGPPAGETLVTMGEHLSELRNVEQTMRRELAQVTGTLSNTAALFGPLVGGATVTLAGEMGSGTPLASTTSVPLGLIVGWYVLVLAAVLTALSTGLTRGLDRALVGYRVGLALLSATAIYLTAVVATGLLVCEFK